MSDELTVIEQKEVVFYDDVISAVLIEDGSVYVPIRPICEHLGIQWSAQSKRINRDDILSQVKGMSIMDTPGGQQKMTCLPLDYLNGWMFGLTTSRVKPKLRESLRRYKLECYQVLSEAFGRNMVTARPDQTLMTSDAPAALAYRNAVEVANLARQQFYLEQRLESAESALASTIARVDAIEAELGNPDHLISTSQQMGIVQAVKSLAHELGKRSGRNEYQGVYGELYRRFQVSSYKQLPAAKYDEAMNFLRDWYSSIVGDDVPF